MLLKTHKDREFTCLCFYCVRKDWKQIENAVFKVSPHVGAHGSSKPERHSSQLGLSAHCAMRTPRPEEVK